MRNGLRPLGLLGAWMIAGCSDSGGDSNGSQTDGGGGSGAHLTWCDVEPILETYCQRCHTDPPKNGAPFPLLTYEDTQAQDRYEHIGSAVSSEFMPPLWLEVEPPVEPLPCSERETLLAWVAEDAPPAPDDDPSCTETSPALVACQ